MSLYYKPYENDIDLINLLMGKYGPNVGMARFRQCKIDSGYHEETSYKSGAEIKRWVKNKKNAKSDAKNDTKSDAKNDTKSDAKNDTKSDA